MKFQIVRYVPILATFLWKLTFQTPDPHPIYESFVKSHHLNKLELSLF